MKQYLFLLALITVFFISVSPAPSSGAAPEQQATPNESQQKMHYEKNMEERLKKLGKELDELKAKAAAMTEQARKDIDRQLAAAEKKRVSASRAFEKMRKESATKWKKVTAEMDAAADDFEKAFEKAKARFKEQHK